ncbi:hypothetical protein P1X14_15515 [Sphingomonas sp. AOB5]|uniref:hypothetical protein n=1 Tax=Sphingomonas sp. AOB5 TaxID=3034017 RepID=UPI0023F67BD2|nr:hypothetical protein [Sphingomonas sp. AOB5]MDF7776665.1 hypothetical protein [Sphingomonas sp. AOB5]
MTPPDLKDPVQRAAYRQELRGVAVGLRRTGVALAAIGGMIALVRLYAWPEMPALVPGAVVGVGLMTMIAAIAARTKYHQLRMRG